MARILARPGAQYGCFGNVAARLALLAVALGSWLAFSPLACAQGVVVTVSTVPAGATYQVDAFVYTQQQSFNWPVGSVHTLVISSVIQPYDSAPTVWTFKNWTGGGMTYTTPTITVTASATATQYVASFAATYTLTANISYMCGSLPCINGTPGVIELGNAPFTGPAPYGAGSVVTLTAVANPGFAFASWTPGAYQSSGGSAVDVITMNAPIKATANFLVAPPITLASVPAGLELLVDGTPTTTPFLDISLGWGTSHVLSAISPQPDSTGNHWVFSSWSDGGAATHTYTVPMSANPVTLTANYVPVEVFTFITTPPNLAVTVDGRNNYNNGWVFAWAPGTVHTFSAPATGQDGAGNLWGFTGWSNGGPQTQTLTVGTSGATLVATYQQLGQLTVNSSLPGVSVSVNGTPCATPCTEQPPLGTSLTLTAPASIQTGVGQQQRLVGWSSGAGPGSLTIAAPARATTVTAIYQLMNQLTISTNPAGAATWTLQPASPDGYYAVGTVVNISLSPQPGYQFREWSGDLDGIVPLGTAVMSQPHSATALFASVPFLPTGAVSNGAGPTPSNAVAPGSAISIFGVNLTAGTAQSSFSPMPQTLGGLTVAVGSRLLPLYFVSPSQINAELPPDLPVGATSLVVTTPSQATVTAKFTIAQDAPGLFAYTANSNEYALAFHANGTLVTEASRAHAGETLTVYGTGFGPTAPARPEGLAVPSLPPYLVTDPASVQVGTASLKALSAYALPGAVGVDAIQFTLGSGTPSGDLNLTVTINGVVSNTVLLPIQ